MPLRRTLLAAALAVLAALATPASALAGPEIDAAVAELASDPVYSDPEAEPGLSASEEARIEREIAGARAGPVYVAVLPEEALAEVGGDPSAVASEVANGLGRRGTYAVVAGGRFRAGSTEVRNARQLAQEAFEESGDEGLAATLTEFVERVGAERRGEGTGSGGRGGAGIPGWFLLALLGVPAVLLLLRARSRRRAEREELEDVKRVVREDLVALSDDVRALDLDVEMPGVDPAAREDYHRALGAYERASAQLDAARSAEELAGVAELLEQGRFAMASAKARLAGEAPPEHRPPCFFDPRHGPSTRDVEWAPPGGMPRPVPACEADALRVEEGDEPAHREIELAGQRMPYWAGPPMYQPFAGGFFGGFGGGLLPGLLMGTMLGSALGHDHAYAHPGELGGGEPGGGLDFGGGGDFGGFGGGGDFGGGDFGGGGDF
jgi:hypothetical protein